MQTNWVSGTRFSEEDDPDRVRIPWTPPAFMSYQDPVKRRERLRVEKLDLSRFTRFKFKTTHNEQQSFASVVHGVLTEKECAQFIDAINKKVSSGLICELTFCQDGRFQTSWLFICVLFACILPINRQGFTPALINIGGGRQQYIPSYRKGWRMIVVSTLFICYSFVPVVIWLLVCFTYYRTMQHCQRGCSPYCSRIYPPQYPRQ